MFQRALAWKGGILGKKSRAKKNRPSKADRAAAKALWLTNEKLASELKKEINEMLTSMANRIKKETGTDVQLNIDAPDIRIFIQFADADTAAPNNSVLPAQPPETGRFKLQ